MTTVDLFYSSFTCYNWVLVSHFISQCSPEWIHLSRGYLFYDFVELFTNVKRHMHCTWVLSQSCQLSLDIHVIQCRHSSRMWQYVVNWLLKNIFMPAFCSHVTNVLHDHPKIHLLIHPSPLISICEPLCDEWDILTIKGLFSYHSVILCLYALFPSTLLLPVESAALWEESVDSSSQGL